MPYWEAFWTLHRSRGYAMGATGGMPLGIAYSEISAYARDQGLLIDETVQLVGKLDLIFIDYSIKAMK